MIIPEIEDNKPCSLLCGEHGRCQRYTNKKSLSFCRCDQGYSGSRCQIKEKCSYCLTSSICICPLEKFVRFCYLKHSVCQSCSHDSVCVLTDDRISLNRFTCLCSEGYFGERCENENNQITIDFNRTIIENKSLLLFHFITAFSNAEHERITVLKKVPFDDQNLKISITQMFHILIVEISNEDYYLAILREIFIQKFHRNNVCLFIDQLNKTLSQYEYSSSSEILSIIMSKI